MSRLGTIFVFTLIILAFFAVAYPLYRSSQVASSLTEGSVWNMESSLDGDGAVKVRIFGTIDGWNGWKIIKLKSLPQGIQVKDKVKVIPLGGGEFTIEKIPDGKGDQK